jgi:hypothetical protein
MHRPGLPPLAISDAHTEPSRFQRCGKTCCVGQAFSLTRIRSSSFCLLPLIRVVRASALAGALVAPTKMICKSSDPVAKRKKNSSKSSLGDRVLRPDSHPPSPGARRRLKDLPLLPTLRISSFGFRISTLGFPPQFRFVYSPRVLSLQRLREQTDSAPRAGRDSQDLAPVDCAWRSPRSPSSALPNVTSERRQLEPCS